MQTIMAEQMNTVTDIQNEIKSKSDRIVECEGELSS